MRRPTSTVRTTELLAAGAVALLIGGCRINDSRGTLPPLTAAVRVGQPVDDSGDLVEKEVR